MTLKTHVPGSLLHGVQASFAGSLQALENRMSDFSSHVDDQDLSSSDGSFYERPLPEAAAPQGPWRRDPPVDAPWEGASGIMKLARDYLPRHGPPAPRWVNPPANHLDSLENLYGYILASRVPEDLATKRHQFLTELEDLRDHPPAWMRLEHSGELLKWKETLESVPMMDQRGIDSFVEVLRAPGTITGFYEANRILVHLLKDSTSSLRSSGRVGPWMHKATTEALDAIANWREWDADHQRTSGLVWTSYEDPRGKAKGYWAERPSRQSPSSSSRWASQPERDPWSRWRTS